MAFSLADVLADVPSLDTEAGKNREQIEYINVDLLHPDPNNFYELKSIDELAANIELLGLQQPVRARKVDDGYMIVSGHRRTAAIRKLVEDGREDLRQVPCIVEAAASSPELQELRLIYANSDTRVMSSADLARQAERVEMLLYQLKEQGIEFPGRMRDHVAEACKMSKSKLARLKVIRENLAVELKPKWEKGSLNESTAYAFARLPREDQLTISSMLTACRSIYEHNVQSAANDLNKFRQRDCPADVSGGKCSHAEELLKKLYSGGYRGYTYCSNGCCSTCPDIGRCKSCCPAMVDSAKLAKQAEKDRKAREKAAQAVKDAASIEQIKGIWRRFGEARAVAGLTVKNARKAAQLEFYGVGDEDFFKQHEGGSAKFTANSCLPFGYSVSLNGVNALLRMAQALGCSIDFLLGNDAVTQDTTAPSWKSGKPKQSGSYVAKFDCIGTVIRNIVWYDHLTGDFYFSRGGPKLDADCIGWYPIPED